MNRSFLGHAGRGRRFRLQVGTLRGEPPQACLRHACAPGPRIRRCSRIPVPVPHLSEGPVFRTHARPISPAALYNKEQRRIPGHRLTSCLDVPRRANPVQAKSVRGAFYTVWVVLFPGNRGTQVYMAMAFRVMAEAKAAICSRGYFPYPVRITCSSPLARQVNSISISPSVAFGRLARHKVRVL